MKVCSRYKLVYSSIGLVGLTYSNISELSIRNSTAFLKWHSSHRSNSQLVQTDPHFVHKPSMAPHFVYGFY